jgi:nucleoside-diphosphate-sugar epimerase
MRIALTGALGIVGSRAAQALTYAGHEVLAIDNRERPDDLETEFRRADLTSYEQTCDVLGGAECVVHLAGINAPIVAPEWRVHNNNVVASYNVLSAAAELGVSRVVQSSSVNAIGLAWSRKPRFDYFPVDLQHQTRNEDGYSLSKLIQELQADSITRRHDSLSVVSLRLHAVLEDAAQAQLGIDALGDDWAINGLFGYCTFESVVSAIELSCSAPVTGHEVLWVTEPETFVTSSSAELAERYFPEVRRKVPLVGRQSFFDISRTESVLGWTPSTVADPPRERVKI